MTSINLKAVYVLPLVGRYEVCVYEPNICSFDYAALTVRFLTKRFIGEYGDIGKFELSV